MSTHLVVGVRNQTLMNTLAALGLVRILAEQADPHVRCSFVGNDLKIATSVEDLAEWLAERYVPTPILSPWNEGSGFGSKDKAPREALAALLALPPTRVEPFHRAMDAVSPIAMAARKQGWDKRRTVREVRNVCPDEMIPWLDAAVVVLDSNTITFPPLLGSGGNDGRLDFSTNFHQRLLEVIPTEPVGHRRSVGLALDWLNSTSELRLSRAAVGQFDPGAAGTPNSSPYGGADSVVNPWAYVLMIEGAIMFSAAPARKLSAQAMSATRTAMTFTTFGSKYGSKNGAALEDSRGEIWLPWWSRSLSFPEIRMLFSEGRAVWRGRTATQSEQMYLAASSRSVSPGIDGFDRYMIVKRNGLAFSAVLADSVHVRSVDSLELVAALEDWPNSVARLSDAPATIRDEVARFSTARISLATASSIPHQIAAAKELLSARVSIELAVARSDNARQDIDPRRLPSSEVLVKLLRQPGWNQLLELREFRIAVGLASVITNSLIGVPQGRSIRELLVPIDPQITGTGAAGGSWRASALVPGLGAVRIDRLASEIARWLSIAVAGEAQSGRGVSARGGDGRGRQVRGFLGPSRGVRVPPEDLHAWVRGDLSDQDELETWFFALLALDWRGTRLELPTQSRGMTDPLLGLLTPFREGISPSNSAASVFSDLDETAHGLASEWIAQLCAGNIEKVEGAVRRRLRQLGYDTPRVITRSNNQPRYGMRLAAALVPRPRSTYAAFRHSARALRDEPERADSELVEAASDELVAQNADTKSA